MPNSIVASGGGRGERKSKDKQKRYPSLKKTVRLNWSRGLTTQKIDSNNRSIFAPDGVMGGKMACWGK